MERQRIKYERDEDLIEEVRDDTLTNTTKKKHTNEYNPATLRHRVHVTARWRGDGVHSDHHQHHVFDDGGATQTVAEASLLTVKPEHVICSPLQIHL